MAGEVLLNNTVWCLPLGPFAHVNREDKCQRAGSFAVNPLFRVNIDPFGFCPPYNPFSTMILSATVIAN